MIFSFEAACALQSKNVQRFLDHADQTAIPPGGLADLTSFTASFRDIKAFLAKSGIRL